MRKTAILLGVVLFAGAAGAQSKLDGAQVTDSSAVSSDAPSPDPNLPRLFAVASPDPSANAPSSSATEASSSLPEGPAPQENAPGVQSVFPQYNWEAYVGYTFLRFYVVPSYTKNTNGLNIAVQWFHRSGSLGVDGESIATFAGVANHTGKLWTGMGGIRYRWAAPRGVEIWTHGLAGGAKFVPQTPYGGQTAFAYQVGAGVDVGAFNHRLAFRFAGDMVGTRFFSAGQYSPKVSAGIVFKY